MPRGKHKSPIPGRGQHRSWFSNHWQPKAFRWRYSTSDTRPIDPTADRYKAAVAKRKRRCTRNLINKANGGFNA